MGFWTNLFGTARIEQPQPVYYHSWQNLPLNTCVLPYEPLKWYKENPFVHSAIEERAKALAKAKFYFEKEDGELIENEYTAKLNKPNDYQSGEDWLKQFGVFLCIYGTGYIYQNKLLPSTPINKTDLLILPASSLKFELPNDYLWAKLKKQPTNDRVWYLADSLMHQLEINYLLPIFDTTTFTNPYYSESKLKSLLYAVSNSKVILESTNTFMSNPGGIGIITSTGSVDGTAKIMNPIEKEELEREMAKDYGSGSGKRPLQIVRNPINYISTTPKIGDLKLNDTLIQQGLIIFGAFGLPKEAFTALQQGSTFENQRESYKQYIESQASVDANNIASTLTTAWGLSGGKLIAKYDHLAVMQEDEKMKSEVFKNNSDTIIRLIESGLLTAEEGKNLLKL